MEPDIADLAFLSDRHGAALLDARGTVVWLCLPRMDHGSVCAALLDEQRGGRMALAPEDAEARCTRRYRDGSLLLETTWETEAGVARVVDALAIGTDGRPLATLVRRCEGLRGEMRFAIELAPRFDYGAASPWIRPGAGRGSFRLSAGDDGLLVTTDAELERTGDHRLAGTLTVTAGEAHTVVVEYVAPSRLDEGRERPEADTLVQATAAAWASLTRELHADDTHGMRASAVVLLGLADATTGAVAAAATTSLPESAAGRTWDYRATWIRDAVFTARSLSEVGAGDAAEAFERFIERTAAGNAGEVRILYGLGGERRLPELEVGGLRGWRGIGPVRVGNGAAGQEQHDVLGELLNLAWRRCARGAIPDADDWRFLRAVADRAAACWREPDRGIWEWREAPRHFVHSKALCWSALDRALALADAAGHDAPRERWEQERDAIRAAVDSRGVDRRGVFVQAFDGEDLDAAVLLLPVAGYCAWDDPRMLATVDAVRAELDDGGLLRRYAVDDGNPGREHAFTACTFWLAECLARQGRTAEARAAFDAAMAVRTPLGLFSEQADARTGASWGNFPQALTHLSHLSAARALA
jgi:GH15 family glucan-1,4-alpha-glucosidase